MNADEDPTPYNNSVIINLLAHHHIRIVMTVNRRSFCRFYGADRIVTLISEPFRTEHLATNTEKMFEDHLKSFQNASITGVPSLENQRNKPTLRYYFKIESRPNSMKEDIIELEDIY